MAAQVLRLNPLLKLEKTKNKNNSILKHDLKKIYI